MYSVIWLFLLFAVIRNVVSNDECNGKCVEHFTNEEVKQLVKIIFDNSYPFFAFLFRLFYIFFSICTSFGAWFQKQKQYFLFLCNYFIFIS